MNVLSKFITFLTETDGATEITTISGLCEDPSIKSILELVHMLYLVLLIAVPTLVLIMSIVAFVKALASSKDDEIRSAQGRLIKSIIAMVIVLLIQLFVTAVISVVDSSLNGKDSTQSTQITDCIKIVVGG